MRDVDSRGVRVGSNGEVEENALIHFFVPFQGKGDQRQIIFDSFQFEQNVAQRFDTGRFDRLDVETRSINIGEETFDGPVRVRRRDVFIGDQIVQNRLQLKLILVIDLSVNAPGRLRGRNERFVQPTSVDEQIKIIGR